MQSLLDMSRPYMSADRKLGRFLVHDLANYNHYFLMKSIFLKLLSNIAAKPLDVLELTKSWRGSPQKFFGKTSAITVFLVVIV